MSQPEAGMGAVLLVTQAFPPETGAGARRVGAMASALAERVRLRVLTLEPSYPNPELFQDLDLAAHDRGLPYAILRGFRFEPYKRSLLIRGVAELRMARRLAAAAKDLRANMIIVSTPSMFLAPAFQSLARRWGAIFVWDLRDITWRYVRETGNGGWAAAGLSHFLEWVMVRTLRHSDHIIAATPGIADLLTSDYAIDPDRTVVCTNGVSRRFLASFDALVPAPEANPSVLYLGLLGRNHGIEILLQVARRLPDVDFVIVGDGPGRPELEAGLASAGLANLRLHPYSLDRDELAAHYRRADIVFTQTRGTPVLTQTALPAKLFEYMATGKPLVYAGEGAAVEFLSRIGCAEIAPPGDVPAIAAAVSRLVSDPARRREMGRLGREHVQRNYVREQLMDQLAAKVMDWIPGIVDWRRSSDRPPPAAAPKERG